MICFWVNRKKNHTHTIWKRKKKKFPKQMNGFIFRPETELRGKKTDLPRTHRNAWMTIKWTKACTNTCTLTEGVFVVCVWGCCAHCSEFCPNLTCLIWEDGSSFCNKTGGSTNRCRQTSLIKVWADLRFRILHLKIYFCIKNKHFLNFSAVLLFRMHHKMDFDLDFAA